MFPYSTFTWTYSFLFLGVLCYSVSVPLPPVSPHCGLLSRSGFGSVWKIHRCYTAPAPKPYQTFVISCCWVGQDCFELPFTLACCAFNGYLRLCSGFPCSQWVVCQRYLCARCAFSCPDADTVEVLGLLLLYLHLNVLGSMGISCFFIENINGFLVLLYNWF